MLYAVSIPAALGSMIGRAETSAVDPDDWPESVGSPWFDNEFFDFGSTDAIFNTDIFDFVGRDPLNGRIAAYAYSLYPNHGPLHSEAPESDVPEPATARLIVAAGIAAIIGARRRFRTIQ